MVQIILLLGVEIIFAYATVRTYPVIGDIFPRGAGGNAAVRVSNLRIIDITTYGTYVFHYLSPYYHLIHTVNH